ncbi:MAG: N-acetyltransferase [Bacteroidales bacterium]|nr:N-acetyltransferase [Bacteroidales bacterium]
MSVDIKRVESGAELKAFVNFPTELYKHCPQYVPSLFEGEIDSFNPKTNPAYEFCHAALFLAYKDGKIAGRVAAIVNEIANRDWNHKEVRFGWLDFIDDSEVSKALINAVEEFGKSLGMTSVVGPLGFTDFDNEGMVVDGFKEVSTFMLKYNAAYYPAHLEALGFEKVIDWLEYRIYVPDKVPERVTRMMDIVKDRYNLGIHKASKREIRKKGYGRKIFELINKAYKNLFDFTLLPDKMIDYYVNVFLGILDMNYVILVEDKSDGRLVGVAVAMPSVANAAKKARGRLFPFGWFHIMKSLYLKHEDAVELLIIGVDPEYRNRGVNAIIFAEMIPRLHKGGFKYAESNAELETNLQVQNQWNPYVKRLQRRRRVYGKSL